MKNVLVMAILAAVFLAACASPKAASAAIDSPPAASGKTAILVIPQSDVQDNELGKTRSALEKAGVKVLLAAPTIRPVRGMLGGKFKPDFTIADIDPSKADMLAVIGGTGSYALWENQELILKIQAFKSQDKLLAAICAAPGVLAHAGVLEGLEATCYPDASIIDTLESRGAKYVDQAVVVSGKVVTGNGPDASASFGAKLVALLD